MKSNLFLFILIVSSLNSFAGIFDIALRGQKRQVGVGYDQYDGARFVTHSFFGVSSEEVSGQGVKVAVIDSGVNLDSPFLNDNINLASINSGNNLDDDILESIDRLREKYGMPSLDLDADFMRDNFYPKDRSGYGTFIAGVIRSIAFKTTILPIKVYDYSDDFSENIVDKMISAIDYAILKNAKIIHLSLRSLNTIESQNDFWHKAFNRKYFEREDVIFVISEMRVKKSRVLSRGKIKNLVSVCAIDKQGKMLSISLRKTRPADICALGDDVNSLALDGISLEKKTGEFAAAAFVSSALALVYQINPEIPTKDLMKILKNSAVKTTELSVSTEFGGYLSIDNILSKVLR